MIGNPFPFPVEAGKVREFARATRSQDAAYLGEDGSQVAPPTFVIRAMFLAGPGENVREENRSLGRTLHAEQEFVFPGPPPLVGARLTAQQRTGPVVTKTGRRGGEMTFTEIDTEFRDEVGVLVVEARFTTVLVSQVPDSDPAGGSS